jgi:hypothetical protein
MNPLSILYLLFGFTANTHGYNMNPGCWKGDILLAMPNPNYTFVIRVRPKLPVNHLFKNMNPHAEILQVKTIDAL